MTHLFILMEKISAMFLLKWVSRFSIVKMFQILRGNIDMIQFRSCSNHYLFSRSRDFLLHHAHIKSIEDGLNSLKYKVKFSAAHPLYTKISVDLLKETDTNIM